MDIDTGAIVGYITASTTSYLSEFSPIFYLIGGLVLAFVVIEYLLDLFFLQKRGDNNDVIDL